MKSESNIYRIWEYIKKNGEKWVKILFLNGKVIYRKYPYPKLKK